jgi:zinc/manganese transport system permease protein
VQEAIIGVTFIVAANAAILLLATNPHGAENLKDLLVGQILWSDPGRLALIGVLYAAILALWFGLGEKIGRIGFYLLFACAVTASVQLVGVYLVFTSLIVPAVATYRHSPRRQLVLGYALAIGSYLAGLGVSLVTDLPSSPVIVWVMGILGLIVHLTGRNGSTAAKAPAHP